MDLRKQGTGTFYPVRYPYPKWNSIEIFHEKNKEKDNDCFITTPQKEKKKETALNRSGNCNNILTFYLEIPAQKKMRVMIIGDILLDLTDPPFLLNRISAWKPSHARYGASQC